MRGARKRKLKVPMDTIDWLRKFAPGFRALSDDERQAIADFLFLGSLFEAKALNEHGNASRIVASAARWAKSGQLDLGMFRKELEYFRDRYVDGGEFTCHFDQLRFREKVSCKLVQKVLKGENAAPQDIAAALLIIVYRFRNNLFHGVKWSYELRGQRRNFKIANAVLMRAIELHENSDHGDGG